MKLTQHLKTQPIGQKAYKHLGLHPRTPQPAQRDQYPSISRQEYNLSKQMYTSRSANSNGTSKICPYQDGLVYSQVNDRINQFYANAHGAQSYNTNSSNDKRNIEKRSNEDKHSSQPQRERQYQRQKQRVLDYRKQEAQNLQKLKNQIMKQVTELMNQHKMRASNSLKQGIIKLDERLRRQCLINFNRQFLPLSFMDDIEKQFQELESRVKNTEIGITQVMQISSQKQKQKSMAKPPTLTLTPSITSLNLNCQQQPKTKQLQNSIECLKEQLCLLQQKYSCTEKQILTLKTQNQQQFKQIKCCLNSIESANQSHQNLMRQIKHKFEQKLETITEELIKKHQMEVKGLEMALHEFKIEKNQNLEKLYKRIDRVVQHQNDLIGQMHKLKIQHENIKREENTVSNKVTILEKDMQGLKTINSQDMNSPKYNMKKSLSFANNLPPINTTLSPTVSPTVSPQSSPKTSIQHAFPPVLEVPPVPNAPKCSEMGGEGVQSLKNSLICQPKSMSLTYSLSSIGDPQKDPIISSIKSLRDIGSAKYILDNENNLMDDNGNYILNEDGTHIKLSEQQLLLLRESNVVKYREH